MDTSDARMEALELAVGELWQAVRALAAHVGAKLDYQPARWVVSSVVVVPPGVTPGVLPEDGGNQ